MNQTNLFKSNPVKDYVISDGILWFDIWSITYNQDLIIGQLLIKFWTWSIINQDLILDQ